jgi:hypothetical protein
VYKSKQDISKQDCKRQVEIQQYDELKRPNPSNKTTINKYEVLIDAKMHTSIHNGFGFLNFQYAKVATCQSYKVPKCQNSTLLNMQIATIESATFQKCNFKCQSYKLQKCQSCKGAKVAKCQNCKVPKIHSVKVARCQSCKVRKLQGLKIANVPKLQMCQNFKVPKLQSAKVAECQVAKVPSSTLSSCKSMQKYAKVGLKGAEIFYYSF